MPLYESCKFAENRIEVKPEWRAALTIGPEARPPDIGRRFRCASGYGIGVAEAVDVGSYGGLKLP